MATKKKKPAEKARAPKKKTSAKATRVAATRKKNPVAKTRSATSAKAKTAGSPSDAAAGMAATRLAEGARAPAFSLPDQNEAVVSSEDLSGAPYILYFYPKDDTPGCTREACGFRDEAKAFQRARIRVVGVSPDSSASHRRFSEKYGLDFTLLSDADRSLAKKYGSWIKKQNYGRQYMGIERSTFLIDARGNVKKVWRNVKVDGHVAKVLEAAKDLA